MQRLKKSYFQRANSRVTKNEMVLGRLQSCQCRLLTLTNAGQLTGIVNLDNIMDLIKIQTVMQKRHK